MIALFETWLTDSHIDFELLDSRYIVLRADRNLLSSEKSNAVAFCEL